MPEKGPSRSFFGDGGTLAAASARNTPVELHRRADDGLEPVMRARLIALDEAHLYLDAPQTIGLEPCVKAEEQLVGYFDLGEDMYTFETTVVHAACNIRLNSEMTVPGMALSRPKEVRRGQRRSYYRRSMAAEGPVPVVVHAADPSHPDTCPVDTPRLEGLLVDASEGGFGMNLSMDAGRVIQLWDQIFVRFELPGTNEETVLLCQVRQIRRLSQVGQLRLGLMALPWPDHRYLNQTTRRLAKYLVDLERKARSVRAA